ncbi:MAG: hypothetical protein L0G81_11165 [Ewingella sp.]|nr:hypothetical protein [Ewingella sp.]
MKSISDYLDTSGTGPAVGKTFKLYGLTIGKFEGADTSSPVSLLFVKDGETMKVPLVIRMPEFNLPGPVANPLLKEIKES